MRELVKESSKRSRKRAGASMASLMLPASTDREREGEGSVVSHSRNPV